jgi:hypothetical protein
MSCEVTRECVRSFAVKTQCVSISVTAQREVYACAKVWDYSRFIAATLIHKLYIRPPGKNSVELLRQYNLFIIAKTVLNVLKF